MRSVTPSRLDERRGERGDGDGGVFVLDVRPESDYRRGHIEGSYNAPVYRELRRGETEALDAHLDAVPDDADVVTVCKAGIVARTATETLDARGYDAATLTGGYAGWRQYEANTLAYRLVSLLARLRP